MPQYEFLFRCIVACAWLGALSGCIITPYGAYYRPSYPGASASRIQESCHGQTGPESGLRFEPAAGVVFTISTAKSWMERGRQDIPLRIAITIPAGTTLRFVSDDLRLATAPNGPWRKLPATFAAISTAMPVAANAVVDFDQSSPVSADVARLAVQNKPDHRYGHAMIDMFSTGITGFTPQALTMQLPSIQTPSDGGVLRFAPLHLLADTHEKGWLRYKTAENQQERQQNYARCLKNTPQRNCANILDAYEQGFRTATDGFVASGRLFVATYRQDPPLSGEVDIDLASAAPWQFTSPEVSFRDPATGEIRQSRFQRFTLTLGWFDVPWTTPIQGRGEPGRPSTHIAIEVSLGDAMSPHFYIRLPTMRINGLDVQPKVIELELRRFDGGIQPFNC